MTKTIVFHLVSPSAGERLELLARTIAGQLENVTAERHLWKMVRDEDTVGRVLAGAAEKGGFVLHTIAEPAIRRLLEQGCQRLDVPCMFVLEPFVATVATHFGASIRYRASARDVMDDESSRRLDAMRFTLAHDDGLALQDIESADVVLLGVSRATKTPTCMYLAHRGVKAANVPLVPGVALPQVVIKAKKPLKVGLTIAPEHLVRVRQERLQMLKQNRATAYSDIEAVSEEVKNIRRMLARYGWPVIDVTHKSIEQTAAMIMELLKRRREVPQ